MFGEFLSIVFKSIKLDKSLYSDNKNFGEASVYFAGVIMILDGIAGAVAANTVIKTAIAMSGLTSILTWFCLLYTSPSPRDGLLSRMPSSA